MSSEHLEITQVSEGHIKADLVVDILRPFIVKIATTTDGREISHIRKFIFTYLIRQSDLGLEYQAKYQAWKQLGFPGSINSMQKVKLNKQEKMSSDKQETEHTRSEKPLDPRAGRVNVELPQIKFNAKKIAQALLELKFSKNSTKQGRNIVTSLAKQFTSLANGLYPLGIKTIGVDNTDDKDINIRKAAKKLIKFEQKLLGKEKKRKRNKENEEQTDVKAKRQKTEISNANSLQKTGSDNKKKKISKNSEMSIDNDDTGNNSTNNRIHTNDMKNKIKIKKNYPVLLSIDKKKDSKFKKPKEKLKRVKKLQHIINNIECVFERNSGTWVVYDISDDAEEHKIPSQRGNKNKLMETSPSLPFMGHPTSNSESTTHPLSTLDSIKKSPEKSTESNVKSNSKNKNYTKKSTPTPKKLAEVSLNKSDVMEIPGLSKSGISPIKLFESSTKEKELFPKSDWDEAEQGEYEICIPSKKDIKNMKKLLKNNQIVHKLNNTTGKIRGKSRLSLEASLCKNPFSPSSSTKKVKINTKLNSSQEIYEHHRQILSSPGIPYDANKKPSKPLLKTPTNSTPINPFYKKQLQDW